MNGFGNDFVVFDVRVEFIFMMLFIVVKIVDCEVGIGCD